MEQKKDQKKYIKQLEEEDRKKRLEQRKEEIRRKREEKRKKRQQKRERKKTQQELGLKIEDNADSSEDDGGKGSLRIN